MGRSRFVQPEVVRLSLAECARMRHAALLSKGVSLGDEKWRKATADEIAESSARVSQAELDGDFIDVKKELTAGEHRRIWSTLVKDMQAGERAHLDPQRLGKTKIMEYLAGWSFVDQDGRPVPIDPAGDAIDSLDRETYKELVEAIDAHEAEIEAQHELLKKTRTGALTSV